LLVALLLPGWCFDRGAEQAFREPAIAGDHPDPSIIRLGREYWAVSTSGDWGPIFPIFRSRSSPEHWEQVGSVFKRPPQWAKTDFWAPELVNDRGRIFVYYTARNHQGTLCVAVATAAVPDGPYTDHGPLVCQPDGSIDASFIRNRDGTPYLVWKEDGNSRRQPTTIWAQPLSRDGLRLEGKPTSLIKNDAPWEAGVVEAPYILRRGESFYLFYAGNSCCGAACHYAEGVARAHVLTGPWEKDPANPIIHDGNGWRCPGHGTAVESGEPRRHTWMLLHAYSESGGVFVAREPVLVSLHWVHGWPSVTDGAIPVATRPEEAVLHAFMGPSNQLAPGWQWPLPDAPAVEGEDGELRLATTAAVPTALLAREIDRPTYQASVILKNASDGSSAGLAVTGNHRALGIGWQQGRIVLFEQNAGARTLLFQSGTKVALPVELRVEAERADSPRFAWRTPGGRWQVLPSEANSTPLLGWDSGLRIGMIVAGSEGSRATFASFRQ
jgi:xylan 1,4-beta-xylosidase